MALTTLRTSPATADRTRVPCTAGQRRAGGLALRALLPLAAMSVVSHPMRAQSSVYDTARVIEYRGGEWFDGARFTRGSRWIRGGHFIAAPKRAADSVVSVEGLWLVPPYGDAHTHSPDAAYNVDAIRDMYLRVGVFYVQVLTNSRRGRLAIASKVNTAASIDAVYADGAVTSSGGHPNMLYEALGLYRGVPNGVAQRVAAGRSRVREGDSYYTLDSLFELPALVQRLRADTVPILKFMLLDTEHRRTMADDTLMVGGYGLPKDVVRPLVDSAHAMGRRVWVHVETAADMQLALDAGVDGFAHVPGYGVARAADSVLARYRLGDDLVRRVAKARVPVVTTVGLARGGTSGDTAAQRRVTSVFEDNVRRLAKAGALLLTGSDTYSVDQIIADDASGLNEIVGGDAIALLRLRAVTTPHAIFPHRKIGALAPGFEGSFLALGCDPRADTHCLLDIRQRVKQGVTLLVPPQPAR